MTLFRNVEENLSYNAKWTIIVSTVLSYTSGLVSVTVRLRGHVHQKLFCCVIFLLVFPQKITLFNCIINITLLYCYFLLICFLSCLRLPHGQFKICLWDLVAFVPLLFLSFPLKCLVSISNVFRRTLYKHITLFSIVLFYWLLILTDINIL